VGGGKRQEERAICIKMIHFATLTFKNLAPIFLFINSKPLIDLDLEFIWLTPRSAISKPDLDILIAVETLPRNVSFL
jgi:hypothetical protein